MTGKKEVYLVRYRLHAGQLHPIVRFGLSYNGRTVTVDAYVDSGAAYSIFLPVWAERLGVPYRTGRLVRIIVGDGDSIPVYLHFLANDRRTPATPDDTV